MTILQPVIYQRLLSKVRYRHLQAVVLTSQFGSTHKAAEIAGISQPSIAKFLSAVEELIDDSLFERHARGMRPTPACRAILPFFEATLKLLSHGAQSLHDVQSGAAGSLHIGALPAACHGEIMAGVAQFSQRCPQFRIHVEENNLAALHEHLNDGVYDVVLVRAPSPLDVRHRFHSLQEDHSIVLARKGHRLTRRRELTLQELALEKWLVLPMGNTSRTIFESWFSAMLVRPSVVNISTPSLSALTSLVAEVDALIVLPQSFAIPALASGKLSALAVARCDPLLPLGILWEPGRASSAAQAFAEWMIARSTKAQSTEALTSQPRPGSSLDNWA